MTDDDLFKHIPYDDLLDRVDEHRPHRDFEGNPISMRQWANLMEREDRIVAQDRVGPYFVSTVWVGLDHGFGGTMPPLIFETMVFKDEDDDRREDVETRRYSTWAQAEQGHAELLNEVSLLAALG